QGSLVTLANSLDCPLMETDLRPQNSMIFKISMRARVYLTCVCATLTEMAGLMLPPPMRSLLISVFLLISRESATLTWTCVRALALAYQPLQEISLAVTLTGMESPTLSYLAVVHIPLPIRFSSLETRVLG